MRIEMTSDFRVAEDGFTVVTWAAGTVHETSEQLGRDLIGAKVARPAKAGAPLTAEEPEGNQ